LVASARPYSAVRRAALPNIPLSDRDRAGAFENIEIPNSLSDTSHQEGTHRNPKE
jgi:hypothetical protein